MNFGQLLALAERCESLTEPRGEIVYRLNGDIAEALGIAPEGAERGAGDDADRWFLSGRRAFQAPDYARSLDAASTLIPAEYDWIIGNVNGRHGGTPYACVGSLDEVFANTPILALCGASLRATAIAAKESVPCLV